VYLVKDVGINKLAARRLAKSLREGFKLWQSLEFDERVKLQKLLFNDGLEFDGEKFGTAKTNSIFSMLSENAAAYETMATPGGIED